MVDIETVIEELNTGKIEFVYNTDDCCTTEGEVVIILKSQQEEIERLGKLLDMSRKVSLARRDSNLKIGKINLKLTEKLKIAKSEAIKDCVRRLKQIERQKGEYGYVTLADLDKVKKEMTEGGKV